MCVWVYLINKHGIALTNLGLISSGIILSNFLKETTLLQKGNNS